MLFEPGQTSTARAVDEVGKKVGPARCDPLRRAVSVTQIKSPAA